LQELRTILNNDARRHFQNRKHASLDVKSAKQLEDLLKASSSSDEFEAHRKSYQERKHKSLDARHISFKEDKEAALEEGLSSDEEDIDNFKTSLLKVDADITKPVVIDLKVRHICFFFFRSLIDTLPFSF
jgi:facilitated trehalose transporter